MTCKYFKKNEGGQPICKNDELNHVKYCPFDFTINKKAPQCCTVYKKGARRAFRGYSSDDVLQKAMHAVWVALPFHHDTVTVTVENACGDTICFDVEPTDDGQWKVCGIKTCVDGGSVFKRFRKALFHE